MYITIIVVLIVIALFPPNIKWCVYVSLCFVYIYSNWNDKTSNSQHKDRQASCLLTKILKNDLFLKPQTPPNTHKRTHAHLIVAKMVEFKKHMSTKKNK